MQESVFAVAGCLDVHILLLEQKLCSAGKHQALLQGGWLAGLVKASTKHVAGGWACWSGVHHCTAAQQQQTMGSSSKQAVSDSAVC
jgi:hypothetical protein